jgi:hypothetical protein
MKDRLITIRNHVTKHRFKYGVAAGVIATVSYARLVTHEWDEFLREQGVYDAWNQHRAENA